MPVKKMRVEVYDESGNRYVISLEGRITRKNALRILDMIELLGGMPSTTADIPRAEKFSKIEKVQFIVERYFPLVWFSAKDVQSLYQKETKEQISLSTVSTYLSRLSERGLLSKQRSSNRVLYRLMSSEMREIMKKY